MFKTLSAALLAVSVIAAPALAATANKTARAPVAKSTEAPAAKTAQAPVIKAEPSKSKFLSANARMGRHHHQHVRHHRHYKQMGMHKTHAAPKFAIKHAMPAKRG